ncbi:MAG TPA: hypothetical protein VE078_04490 [Thermoanaerobaculia bacterium]|nr:hypothetical protein [Thermoanaerobaculia bacterium]
MSQHRADGLFTGGVPRERYHLPHPRLELPMILLVRQVVLRAFELLCEYGYSLATEQEDSITAALRGVIENDLRHNGSVKGFSRRTYDTVIRQGQVANFDGTKRAKAPDLCFRLRNDEEEPRPVLSEHDALFVECKPVDKSHAAGSNYCDAGLCRFVDGDYAWAMEEGLMLGYARHGRTIAKNLIPALQKVERLGRLKTVELPRPVEHPGAVARDDAEALHVSRHRRGFPWVAGKGPASDILIYHSWHNCG